MPSNFDTWPYGFYLCRDSVVLFNRHYEPIVRITEPAFPMPGDRAVTACDPREWVEHSSKEWFYDDGTAPRHDAQTRKRLQNLMAAIPALAAEVKRRIAVKRKATAEERRNFYRYARAA